MVYGCRRRVRGKAVASPVRLGGLNRSVLTGTAVPILLGAVLVVAACGVPIDSEPRSIDPEIGPAPATSPVPAATRETLYFVRGAALVAVQRAVDRPPSDVVHLEHLLAGPTHAERGAGLSTALDEWHAMARVLHVVAATAVVEIGDRPDGPIGRDEILAFGQVVCTLTTRTGIHAVTFRFQGKQFDPPRPDGSPGGPVTAADYTPLIAAGTDPRPSGTTR